MQETDTLRPTTCPPFASAAGPSVCLPVRPPVHAKAAEAGATRAHGEADNQSVSCPWRRDMAPVLDGLAAYARH